MLQGNHMHHENVELYKKLDMIRKENAELQMKVEIQKLILKSFPVNSFKSYSSLVIRIQKIF